MANPNDGFVYEPSDTNKRPRGIVDPYEIPNSPHSPPPPKRQRRPLPTSRSQAVNTQSWHLEGDIQGRGSTWGTMENKFLLKSNGIKDWEADILQEPTNNLRDLAPWRPTLQNLPSMDAQDQLISRSPNVKVTSTSSARTLTVKELLCDESSVVVNEIGNNKSKQDVISTTMTPVIPPISTMDAPIANETPVNPWSGQSSSVMASTYSSPHILAHSQDRGQGYMEQASTVRSPITRERPAFSSSWPFELCANPTLATYPPNSIELVVIDSPASYPSASTMPMAGGNLASYSPESIRPTTTFQAAMSSPAYHIPMSSPAYHIPMSSPAYHIPMSTPIAPAPAAAVAPAMIPEALVSTVPATTTNSFTPPPPILLQPKSSKPRKAPRIMNSEAKPRNKRAPKTVASVPVVDKKPPGRRKPVTSVSMKLPPETSTAPSVQAVSADILPEASPHTQRPNGVEQVARRFSLQDYSITDYSVGGSDIAQQIRVFRPGAEKPLIRDTSSEFTNNSTTAHVDALTQANSNREDISRAEIPSSQDARPMDNSVLGEEELVAEAVRSYPDIHQDIEARVESSDSMAHCQHTLIPTQKSVSSMLSARPPSPSSLLSRRSGQGAKCPSQLQSFQSFTAENLPCEEQRIMSYLPTPTDDRRREGEDGEYESGQSFNKGVATVPEQNESRADHLPQILLEDAPSHKLDTSTESHADHSSIDLLNDVILGHANEQTDAESLEIPRGFEDEQISGEPVEAMESQNLFVNDVSREVQTSSSKTRTATEFEVDEIQILDKRNSLLMNLDKLANFGHDDSVNNLIDPPQGSQTGSNMDCEDNERLNNIQAKKPSIDLGVNTEIEPIGLRVDVNEDETTVDSTSLINNADSSCAEPQSNQLNISVNTAANAYTHNLSCTNLTSVELNADMRIEVSSSPESQSQGRERDETATSIRSRLYEPLMQVNSEPEKNTVSEQSEKSDTSTRANINKDRQNHSEAQFSPMHGTGPHTKNSDLSSVKGDWLDTCMESDVDVTEGVSTRIKTSNRGDDCKVSSDNESSDEEIQIDSIQGHRIDSVGKTEFLVKWEDADRALSWEQEEQVLDHASDKLYEFFKKVLLEKKGLESIIKSKKEPGRPPILGRPERPQRNHKKTISSESPTVTVEETAEAAVTSSQVLGRRHSGRPRKYLSLVVHENSATTTRTPITLAAAPTLITRIKTMARKNRGKQPSRIFGEVFLPWVARGRRTSTVALETSGDVHLSRREKGNLEESQNEKSHEAEVEPDQSGIEQSEEDATKIAKSRPKLSNMASSKRGARRAREKSGRTQKQAKRSRIPLPTIVTRMKTIESSNLGQSTSLLPRQIIMRSLTRRHNSRAKALEAEQSANARTHVDVDSKDPETEATEAEGKDPGQSSLNRMEERSKRKTRNHKPRYHDAINFDDLEESTDESLYKVRRKGRSPHLVHLTDIDTDHSNSRQNSASADIKGGTKKPRGRRPGSGYVKDRWYYASD